MPRKYIALAKPNGRHKAFRLNQAQPDGSFKRLQLEELDNINKRYLEGEIDSAEALRLVQDLKKREEDRVRRQLGLSLHFYEANMKLLQSWYDKVYQHRENTKDSSKANRMRAMKKAVGLLHDVSIQTASREDIAAKLKPVRENEPSVYNGAVDCLNTLLKFAGREHVRLYKVDDEGEDVTYLSEDEFRAILTRFEEPEQLFLKVCFATGMRFGEVLGAELSRLKQKSGVRFLYVARQWHYKDARYSPPKRGKKRDTIVLRQFEGDVQAWLKLALEGRLEAVKSHFYLSRKLKDVCQDLWPEDPVKWVTVNGLRHSYATYLLAKGFTLSQLAKFLGNQLKVTEDYYASYVVSEDIVIPAGF